MIETALTTQEHIKLEQCEAVIEQGLRTFVDVGNALLTIRDGRLYRERCKTFEEYCRVQWGFVASRARQLISAAQTVAGLETVTNVTPANEGQVRPLMSLEPEQQQEAWTRAVETAPKGKVTGAHVKRVVQEMTAPSPPVQSEPEPQPEPPEPTKPQKPQKPHVTHNSGNNEWYTPPEYIEAARATMERIELDPASSDRANEIVQAVTYYTAQDDGLAHEWSGRVWMNPPYSSDLIGLFCDKLAYHVKEGNVTEACVLVNNATETGWFNTLLDVASALCLIRSRVKFIDEQGNPSGAPLQGQVVIYIGPASADFEREFSQFGRVLYATW